LAQNLKNVKLGSASFVGQEQQIFICAVSKNGVVQRNVRFVRRMNGNGDVGSASISGILELVSGDILSFGCASDSQISFVSFTDMNMLIRRIGN